MLISVVGVPHTLLHKFMRKFLSYKDRRFNLILKFIIIRFYLFEAARRYFSDILERKSRQALKRAPHGRDKDEENDLAKWKKAREKTRMRVTWGRLP